MGMIDQFKVNFESAIPGTTGARLARDIHPVRPALV